MTNQTILNEFAKSVHTAISKLSHSDNLPEDEVQIVLGVSDSGVNIYKLCRPSRLVRILQIKDILYLSFIYKPFQGMIPGKLKDYILKLAKQEEVPVHTVSVVMCKSSKWPDRIRMMLYVKNDYKRELTIDDILKLN